jgi:carbon storage regulator
VDGLFTSRAVKGSAPFRHRRQLAARYCSDTQAMNACLGDEVERKESRMLVLSRHRDESIMIGDDVVVTIVDIRGDKVRLGIEAPQDIPVHRQEVYEAIQRENRKANDVNPVDTRDLGRANSADGP